MASIEQIKGSDGSGNANVATVQNDRSPGATTIIVDTVLDINPAGFMGTMGTPHTFTDPITSETITVISEATAVDFAGHVDGSNLEIDTIAPGYVDAGSAVGDIVIIRPTTQYADNLAAVIGAAHNDDGTHKSGAIYLLPTIASFVNANHTHANSAGGGAISNVLMSNPYKFSVNSSITQSRTSLSKITFNTKDYDTGNNFDSVTNNRFTAPVAGFYFFTAQCYIQGLTNSGSISLYVNGSGYFRGLSVFPESGQDASAAATTVIQLSANDYVEVFYTGTSTRTIGASGARDISFSGFLVSAT